MKMAEEAYEVFFLSINVIKLVSIYLFICPFYFNMHVK